MASKKGAESLFDVTDLDPGGLADFNLNLDMGDMFGDENTEIQIEPMRYMPATKDNMREDMVMYENALELARNIKMGTLQRANCLVNGTFIFGDFIEAFMETYNVHTERMIISTLSMSQENIDSLANIMNGGYCDKLDLLVSYYFFAHERNVLIPYLYDRLDKDNRFQLSVARVHTKTVQFITDGGKHIVMHGSANLRTSGNLEQFTIEDNPALYKFYQEAWDAVIDKYATINKQVEVKAIWDAITRKKFNN